MLLIDIYDRKRAKDRIRQHEMELRQITDAIPQAIAVLAPDGTTLYTNRAALDWAGLTIEEVRADGFLSRAFHPMMRKGCEPSVARVSYAAFPSNWRCVRCERVGSIAGDSSSTIRSGTNRAVEIAPD